MRSEFFNQIHKNKERYYKERMNQELKSSQVANRTSEYPTQLLQLRLPWPIVSISCFLKPGWAQFGHKTAVAFKTSKYFTKWMTHRISKFIQPFSLQLTTARIKLDQQFESWQEGFYNRVIVLFEEQDGHSESMPGKISKKSLPVANKGNVNESGIIKYLRKLWTSVMISLELDEATTEIRMENYSCKREGDAEVDNIAEKKPWQIRNSCILFKKICQKIFQKINRVYIYPMVNRFIQ
ncbi:MAG: hypothetical protein KQI35_02095 [Bacteroidetes bacterium]|nr:hypothetical protein [Bacteroidota bacterium]